MQLSISLIAEFQKRYRETFGKRISAEKAELELLSLVEIVSITQNPSNDKENYYEKPDENTRIPE